MSILDNIYEKREKEDKQEIEKYKKLLIDSKKEIELADHFLYVTYNTIKELKMLIAIEEHIIKSTFLALNSLLECLRYHRIIEPFPTNKNFMIDTFHKKVIGKDNFELNDVNFLSRLIELEHYIQTSNLQFKRGESYVIAIHDSSIKSLNIEIVKNHLSSAKDFLSRVEKKLNRDTNNI